MQGVSAEVHCVRACRSGVGAKPGVHCPGMQLWGGPTGVHCCRGCRNCGGMKLAVLAGCFGGVLQGVGGFPPQGGGYSSCRTPRAEPGCSEAPEHMTMPWGCPHFPYHAVVSQAMLGGGFCLHPPPTCCCSFSLHENRVFFPRNPFLLNLGYNGEVQTVGIAAPQLCPPLHHIDGVSPTMGQSRCRANRCHKCFWGTAAGAGFSF